MKLGFIFLLLCIFTISSFILKVRLKIKTKSLRVKELWLARNGFSWCEKFHIKNLITVKMFEFHDLQVIFDWKLIKIQPFSRRLFTILTQQAHFNATDNDQSTYIELFWFLLWMGSHLIFKLLLNVEIKISYSTNMRLRKTLHLIYRYEESSKQIKTFVKNITNFLNLNMSLKRVDVYTWALRWLPS